jgi:hypothetical protein
MGTPPKLHRVMGLREKHAREQFARLGQFIQAFEAIVNIIRNSCIEMTLGYHRGVNIKSDSPNAILVHGRIGTLIFSYERLTAQHLLTLWRAITFEANRSIPGFSQKDQELISEIQGSICADLREMIETRNLLIHATWDIGRAFSIETAPLIRVEKARTTKTGLARRMDLPRTAQDLFKLTEDCMKIGRFIDNLLIYLRVPNPWSSRGFKRLIRNGLLTRPLRQKHRGKNLDKQFCTTLRISPLER